MGKPPDPGPIKVELISTSMLHFKWFLEHACDCVVRCRENSPSRENAATKQEEAITAILFSAAAVEAFVNELTHACQEKVVPGKTEKKFVAFAWGMKAAEDSNSSTKSKVELAHLMLTGMPPERGEAPLSEYATLYGLRNDIMHVKNPSTIAISSRVKSSHLPTRVKTLLDGKIASETSGIKHTHWLECLMTLKVAEWSVRTAAENCRYIAEKVPDEQISGRFAEYIRLAIGGLGCEEN